MEAASRDQDDPPDLRCGLDNWSGWHPLLETGAGDGLVPKDQGIYRLRRRGHPELIYVGISERGLRSRISKLRQGVQRVLDADCQPDAVGWLPHSAARCVARHICQGDVIEISWATTGHIDDPRELRGREVDLIAACRTRFRRSPACQFHGSPQE
jgi:hypothetical protein